MEENRYICGICGSDHPTEAHAEAVDTVENSHETGNNASAVEELKQIFGVDYLHHDPDNKEEIMATQDALNSLLENKIFPETIDISRNPDEIDRRIKDKGLSKNLIEGVHYAYKRRGRELSFIGSTLLGRRMKKENLEQDLKEAFIGKKVLVLGDDVGTLSEAINRLGGQAYGVEYDRRKIALAHSGIMAEDGLPQKQVMPGNILHMTNEQSELMAELKLLGPFDLIFSRAVFNGGSGLEDFAEKIYTRNKPEDEKLNFVAKFLDTTDAILEDGGSHLHMDADSTDSQFLSVPMDLADRVNNPVMNHYGFFANAASGHGALFTKKGLIKILLDKYPDLVDSRVKSSSKQNTLRQVVAKPEVKSKVTPEIDEYTRTVNLRKKFQKGEPFTKEDLIFIYEIDRPIEDVNRVRVDKLLEMRNADEDMLTIFECTRDQIVHSLDEITSNTKAYVGPLEPGDFDKVPKSVYIAPLF